MIRGGNIKKQVIITNGSGGVGKDTFVKLVREKVNVVRYSIIDMIKTIADIGGCDVDDKSEKTRLFLCELKKLFADYNDMPYTDTCNTIDDFLIDDCEIGLIMVDCREKVDIDKMKARYNAQVILVKNDNVMRIDSNFADKNVDLFDYDFVVNNSGTIDDLRLEVDRFLSYLKSLDK